MPDRLIAVPELLRALRDRARSLGLAPPAAFLGDWRDRRAVVVPSVDLRPVAQEAAFAESDHLVVVYRSFPDTVPGAAPPLPAAVRGEASGWLTLEADGRWSRHGDAPDPEQVVRDHGRGRRHDRAAAGHNNDDHDGNDGNDNTDREAGRLPDWAAPDRAAHRAAVSDCLEAIRAGEVYQACLSTRLHGTLRADPLETFLAITGHAPAARSAYLEGPWGAVLGFSPEEYLVRRGQVVRSSPIKGTLSADRDPALLLQSAKDIAENIMIVDLVRNDLGRVADVGSVTVTDLLAIRPAPGVHHLVSTVTARTTADNTALVEATFPPASVTGTPKSRARELIAGWVPVSRGLHCGAYGFALGRDLELAVAIRTLEATHDGRVELGVGGGITIDSDPDAEWDECVHKAAFTWGGGPAPWGPG
ncbi:aminodeoxychorismate synthase component I [Dietzia psychralcaliphila]|uniref:Aminodeoxychorismate synthase component I n=1 Tax=Dietzia psychralcaliphila TaxID=139021 RepID=A0AAD0JQQ7_9ACTN|nr:aminodeoxychorismate synthase component I [Dietzia psychralcaliphila]AWH96052.1 aminodeoxychorismate synthase component I [Dietzia psychralcaliphila]